MRQIAKALDDTTGKFERREIDILRSNGDLKEMVLGANPSVSNVTEPEAIMQDISRELSVVKRDLQKVLQTLENSEDGNDVDDEFFSDTEPFPEL